MKEHPKIKHGGVRISVLPLDPQHPDAKEWKAHCDQIAAEDEACVTQRANTYALYSGGITPPEGGEIIFEGYGPGRFTGECSVLIHPPYWPARPALRAFIHCDQMEVFKE